MNKALVAVLAVILGLAAGILIGILIRSKPTFGTVWPVAITPGNPATNGPDAKPETQPVSFSRGDVVRWNGPAGSKLAIVFKSADFDPNSTPNPSKEPPFAGGTAGSNQSIDCVGNVCQSRNINPNLAGPLNRQDLSYKYTQILNGYPKDGHIIIQK
jgi:hypothetical protein